MEITVRVASPSDLTCLHRLQVRASLANAGDRDYLLTNLDVIQVNRQILESGRTFVAQCELKRGDCQVLGFAELEAPVASEVELEGIFVEPSWWRRGVGAALARHCQCFARQEGATRMRVVANSHSVAFYRALGFRPVEDGATKMQHGTAVVMVLELLSNGWV